MTNNETVLSMSHRHEYGQFVITEVIKRERVIRDYTDPVQSPLRRWQK